MWLIGKDEIICDLAETYHIFDYRQLKLSMFVILVYGLKDNSRIKMKIMGYKIDPQFLMLANIFDQVNVLVWLNSKDGQKGTNRPKRIVDTLINENQTKGFNTPEEFEKAKDRIIRG